MSVSEFTGSAAYSRYDSGWKYGALFAVNKGQVHSARHGHI